MLKKINEKAKMNFFSPKIKKIEARFILDSRGFPTISCTMILSSGEIVHASVPTGASTGSSETPPLYDEDPKLFHGKGVFKVLEIINTKINTACINKKPELDSIDQLLKELNTNQNIGSNSMLAISLATLKAEAILEKQQLYQHIAHKTNNNITQMPRIIANVINGGMHAENGICFQEFCFINKETSFSLQPFFNIIKLYHELKNYLYQKKIPLAVGDEGGFAAFCSTPSTEEILQLLTQMINQSNYTSSIGLGIDVAASTFYNTKTKNYCFENNEENSTKLLHFYKKIIDRYSIMMLEDPFSEDDKHAWPLLTESSKNTKIIGDDLYTSHKSLLKRGIQEKYTHGLIIKPNQVGLMSDIFKTIQCAKENNQIIIVSHRSGETLDSSIVDLAVGIGAWGVKIGAPARGERIAKYNRYLEILQTFI